MGRGKLSMKLISNEKSRKTTFLKREKSLMRKAYELSTLCDVRTCVFVFGPTHNDQSPIRVHTWPPCRDEVNDMIASYKANCLHKRTRKAFGLLDFFSERKKKIEADMSKLRKDVAEARFPKWDERLEYLLEDELRVLLVELDSKVEAAKRRMDMTAENLDLDLEGPGGRSAAGSSTQTLTLNANDMMNQKQLMAFEDQIMNYNMLVGSSGLEAQAMAPYQYNQIMPPTFQLDAQMLPTNHDNNFSQYNPFGSNVGSSAQAPFNHANYFQHLNFFSNPQNDHTVVMENQQIYQMCHYGDPDLDAQPIMPLAYMLAENQMMMPNASKSQPNEHHVVDPYLNCEYLIKPNNFSNYP